MTKVIISQKVIGLIADYADNLSEFTGYDSTGKSFERLCYESISGLALMPERWQRYGKTHRRIVVNQHTIIYRYDKINDTIYVTNMKHGSQKEYR